MLNSFRPEKSKAVIVAYHSSPQGDITSFQGGSHFGSREAAIERATANKFNGVEMNLYEVEIQIGNFLEIFDEGGVHSVEYLVDAIRSAKWKAINPFAVETILTTAEKHGQAAGMDVLLEAMVGRGEYDGLVYENNTEDNGSLAWVIFKPEQVCVKNVSLLEEKPNYLMR